MNQETERMLRPREVAVLFKVDPKTVTRWAKTGRLSPITLPSGHRRYRATDVEALMSSSSRRIRMVESHVCPRCGSNVSCDNTSA
ncbi:MAG: helix-turn-helix domain-containing protein [Actinobacteria bacterium]|jgi:predicted site-specific integrase-resolvase|nr:helix-turn-helix domain-containing protein [Actinomycetota bacterium]